ncbi:hypothetical protein [Chryseobacterium balustinum]|uniref:Uncharacterized protein n=1 Tax=Chryseobacterium balustinum TaxID=246 RepID=A0AAX2IJ30_9FLAO|nr:hypothetical protein [Chryseobacterium balustinum]AZB30743.1 hypothetical protein EB354_16635 [Chryseobacterium balustinum]SKB98812.1 hypothetical protein SAMN05421800_11876 [Chryseobacterium balustinum]SQA88823.1 Uncharacterised protein [Chryseobacterium balustinum]
MNIFKSIINNLKIIKANQNIEKFEKDFVTKQIQIHQLPNELKLFLENKTEFDFIGIYSKGDDCIYFAKNGNNLNIEYEAVVKSQVPFYHKLKTFALTNNFKIEETANEGIPYLKIKTNTSIEETFLLAKKIKQDIFGNNDETQYDIVP